MKLSLCFDSSVTGAGGTAEMYKVKTLIGHHCCLHRDLRGSFARVEGESVVKSYLQTFFLLLGKGPSFHMLGKIRLIFF